ncbi:DUF1097 domain-containing protein [Pseudomonas knackmussii]|uniref:DUF1097 domain-containing protein n=1 Tax=Pseudomonas knackmussii TaxID=65741 RepID=UPI003BBB0FA9
MNHTATMTHFRPILGESLIACLAATLCVLVIHAPAWAMFVGWIAFFTRGINARAGLVNLVCVLIGLTLGIATAFASAVLAPYLGSLTIAPGVLLVTLIVLSLRFIPVFNNPLSYFLGVVCYFASQLPPTPGSFIELATAVSLGVLAGLLASLVQKHWSGQECKASQIEKHLPNQ